MADPEQVPQAQVSQVLQKSPLESHASAMRDIIESKPGWKSSEFYITALLIVALVVLVLFDKMTIEDVVNLWPVFVGTGAYALSRGLAKGSK